MGMQLQDGSPLSAAVWKVAQETQLEPAALLAVTQVESGGRTGASIDGRLEPLIRFEGHYFYRLLGAEQRHRAVVAGLAHAVPGRVRNPLTQAGRWRLLARASGIDRPAALQSVSWGVGQVMGAHWRWLGYEGIEALVSDVRSGVEGQVRLMARFIAEAGLSDRLRERDWQGFARAYNGPGFRANRYDEKMERAFAAITGERPVRDRRAPALIRLGARGESVEALQRNLRILGYPLMADGDFGPATEAALRSFQRASGIGADGIFGAESAEAMARRLPPAPAAT